MLRYIEDHVEDSNVCEEHFNLEMNNYICFGTSKIAAIDNGDIGGPLILPPARNPILIGIASSLLPLDISSPSLFTRISSYLLWIKENSGVVYYK